ncbi:MAG TPA: HepT-like ribonuclease domain-containing protein [Thermomicrobiales bacterium]
MVRDAQAFTGAKGRKDLDTDRMLHFALVRAIEIVGEAVDHVSGENRERLSTYPWRAVVGMHDRPSHAYVNTDRDIF